MKKLQPLTHEHALRLLDYDPATGKLLWKMRPSPKSRARQGAEAGLLKICQGRKHRYIGINGLSYNASRVAWFIMHGVWPQRLQFVNGDSTDLRLENLRESFGLKADYDYTTSEGGVRYREARKLRYPERDKDLALRATFGITFDEYKQMHAAQNGKCAVCGNPESYTRNGKPYWLSVDHCHTTGKIRQLLCAPCNKSLGLLKEDVTRVRALADYIEKHRD